MVILLKNKNLAHKDEMPKNIEMTVHNFKCRIFTVLYNKKHPSLWRMDVDSGYYLHTAGRYILPTLELHSQVYEPLVSVGVSVNVLCCIVAAIPDDFIVAVITPPLVTSTFSTYFPLILVGSPIPASVLLDGQFPLLVRVSTTAFFCASTKLKASPICARVT